MEFRATWSDLSIASLDCIANGGRAYLSTGSIDPDIETRLTPLRFHVTSFLADTRRAALGRIPFSWVLPRYCFGKVIHQ